MGRITNIGILGYLITFALLFYIGYQFPNAFTLFVAVTLLFHVYYGEARHIKKQFNQPYLFMTLAFTVLLGTWLALELWPLPLNAMYALIGSAVLVAIASYFFFKQNGRQFEALFCTLLIIYFIFIALEFLGMRPRALESFGFIVIAHYMATYFNVYKSFTKKGQGKQWIFIIESFGMNLLFLFGYILVYNYLGTDNALFDYVYHPISFYVWTLMHFITTMDFKKYRSFVMERLQAPQT